MTYKVQLEKQVYIAGQTISGKVVCIFSKCKTVKDIKVRAFGVERAKWEDEVTDRREARRSSNYNAASNIFYKTDTVVYTGGNLDVGQHEYNFDIKLPEVLPSSYKSDFGSVHYILVGSVKECQKVYKTKASFKLINIIDLNTLPVTAFEPTTVMAQGKLSYLCFNGGVISVEIFLDKKAFTTGEVAAVKIRLRNTSNACTKSVKLELVERITVSTPEPPSEQRTSCKVLSRAGCLANFPRGENVFNLPLLIPENFTILKFHGSTFWTVKYYLLATCVLSSWHTNLVVSSDIIIGHIEAYRTDSVPSTQGTRDSAPPPYSTLPRKHHKKLVAESNV